MMRFLLLLAASASVYAQSCTYSPSPNAFLSGAGSAGTGPSATFTVTTLMNCAWTATANATWIHITNGPSYSSTSIVTFSLDQNSSTQIRKGTITVGDAVTQQTVSITQIAGNCNYQITPPITANFAVSGGTGSFQVTAGCGWSPASNQSWIAVSSPGVAVLGSASVSYSVAANGCVAGRSGAITVSTGAATPPPTFSVTQDGSAGNLALSPSTATFGPATSAGRITVTTGDGCSWSAQPDVSWLQITANSGSGSGTGAITFSLAANVGPSRTGHITVGPQVFTVTQTGAVISGPLLSGIFNGASGAAGAISPGEIVSLFGTGIGPVNGVAYGTTVSSTLGGVQVMFGGVAAPLTYVSDTQVNAIVPYSVTGGTTQVQVQYGGQSSNAMTVPVQAAAPAIFSADMSGHGPGAILNTNYSLNSGANPISTGGAVMIYATGGGATNPPSTDGSLAPNAEPFPRIVQTVSVTIGGMPAQVLYSGGAPGLVSGVIQINAVVPSGIATGPSVPVVLQIGNWQSQPGITLAVQ